MNRMKISLSLGRSFEDYVQMFNFTARDLSKRIIGCGDGLSNFNARLKELGYFMISCDPLYQYSKEHILCNVSEKPRETVRQPGKRLEDNLFLYNSRATVIDEFLEDYETGRLEGRYLPHSLPVLPFGDQAFDISLSSFFLFTQADLGLDFHAQSIWEMSRIAREARIYPLTDLNGCRPDFFETLTEKLMEQRFSVEIVRVEYGFYNNDNEMLIVTKHPAGESVNEETQHE